MQVQQQRGGGIPARSLMRALRMSARGSAG